MRVLLVEDDVNIINHVTEVLKEEKLVIDHISIGKEAINMAIHYDYDIILLDLILPDMDGYEVIKKIRTNKINTPILVLSGLSRVQAKVMAISIGADDFLTKPFFKDELVARIKSIVRRSKGFSQNIISLGEISINTETREVKIKNNLIHLTNKEYLILELLIMRKGMVLTKEIFLNHLYGGIDEPEIKIIDVFICKLRKKLSNFNVHNLIITVWGKGYMMKEVVKNEINYFEKMSLSQ